MEWGDVLVFSVCHAIEVDAGLECGEFSEGTRHERRTDSDSRELKAEMTRTKERNRGDIYYILIITNTVIYIYIYIYNILDQVDVLRPGQPRRVISLSG